MFDPVQAQADLTTLLLSDSRLKDVQVKSYRAMRLQQEIDYRTILAGRGPNGRAGAGILVATPYATCRRPNVAGPSLDWGFPIIAFENDTVNQNPTIGTLLHAEVLAQTVMDILQLYADDMFGTWFLEEQAITEEREYVFKGCLGYRTNLHIIGKSNQSVRVARVFITIAAGYVTLSCGTPGATIRYSLDGSLPGSVLAGTSQAQTYAGPFPVNSGTTIRAVAYLDGMVNSHGSFLKAP